MDDTLVPVQKLITNLQVRIALLEKENCTLINLIDRAEDLILDELQALYDTHMYNTCDDDSLSLVPLEDAKCAVETFLSDKKD